MYSIRERESAQQMATFVKSPCDEGVIRSAPEALPCAPHVGVWVLVATILGSSMAFIDGSAVGFVLFALPGITSGPASYWITFFPAVLVMGVGMAMLELPPG